MVEVRIRQLRVRVGEGTTGMAVRDRKPVWTADIQADSGIPLGPDTRDLVMREGYRAVLSVPIFSKNELYGALSAYWWESHEPSASESSDVVCRLGRKRRLVLLLAWLTLLPTCTPLPVIAHLLAMTTTLTRLIA